MKHIQKLVLSVGAMALLTAAGTTIALANPGSFVTTTTGRGSSINKASLRGG